MKTLFRISILFTAVSVFLFFVQAANGDEQQTKTLVSSVVTKLPHGYDTPVAVIEGGSDWLKKFPEFVQLQAQANSTWSQTTSNFQNVAPTDTTKAIVLEAFESSLNTDNYLQFLDQAAGLAQQGQINKTLLMWSLTPSDKNVRGILEYNFDKPIVKDILQKAKVVYANDPNMLKYCDDILSGAAKKGAETYFNDNTADQRPPQAASTPNPSQTETSTSGSVSSSPNPTNVSSVNSARSFWASETGFPFWIYGIIGVFCLGIIGALWYRSRPK